MPTPGSHPYDALTPERVLTAVDSVGLETDGRLLALHSYENRVYQLGLEEGGFVVAKFYRPGRWSDEAIHEEHLFSRELDEHEIPVVAPLEDARGRTLHEHQGFRFAVFPRRGGRRPEIDDPDTLLRLGRFLGRIHGVGAAHAFEHRPTLDAGFGESAYRYILERDFVPGTYRARYESLGLEVLDRARAALEAAEPLERIRIHGDFHPGNILWREDGGAHLVDLDDCRKGPAVQDLWMLLSGARHDRIAQLSELLEGYEEFRDFDPRELALIEPLRALRLVHYAGWLARRWADPAFPRAFPWFNTERYWEDQIQTLHELLSALDEPPLRLA